MKVFDNKQQPKSESKFKPRLAFDLRQTTYKYKLCALHSGHADRDYEECSNDVDPDICPSSTMEAIQWN